MSRTVADLLVGVLERLEPAFHRTRPQHPRPYWLGDTFEVLGSEVLQLEQIADQFSVCSRRSLSSRSTPTAHLTKGNETSPTLVPKHEAHAAEALKQRKPGDATKLMMVAKRPW